MSLDSNLNILINKLIFDNKLDPSINFTLNITTAWLIVEEMERKGFWLKLLTDWYWKPNTYENGNSAWFTPHNAHHNPTEVVKANTVPITICLAALKALEIYKR